MQSCTAKPFVKNSLEAIFEPSVIGEKVVVIGGGMVGCEIALDHARCDPNYRNPKKDSVLLMAAEEYGLRRVCIGMIIWRSILAGAFVKFSVDNHSIIAGNNTIDFVSVFVRK